MPARRDREGRWRYRKNSETARRGQNPHQRLANAEHQTGGRGCGARAHHPGALALPRRANKEGGAHLSEVRRRGLVVHVPSSVGNRPSTVEEKEIHLRLHLKPTLGRLTLDKIRGEVVGKLVARLRDGVRS